jgi:hypothetical protein
VALDVVVDPFPVEAGGVVSPLPPGGSDDPLPDLEAPAVILLGVLVLLVEPAETWGACAVPLGMEAAAGGGVVTDTGAFG